MGVLVAAVPSHCDPDAEHQVARDMEEQDQQEPPDLHLEVEVRLVLHIHPDEVEADDERQEQDPRDALEEHEEEHGGHTTSGVLS
jgi:hypothetical protein